MKATQATIQQRVEEILSIRLAGAQFVEIRQYVAEKCAAGEQPWATKPDEPPPSERTLWRYIKRSDKVMAESNREGHKRMRVRHQAQRKHLYALALNQGDIRAALACLDSEAKLCGLLDYDLQNQLDEIQRQMEAFQKTWHSEPG